MQQRTMLRPSASVSVAQATVGERIDFLKRVYALFLAGLLVAGGGGYVGLQPAVLEFVVGNLLLSLVVLFGGVFAVGAVRKVPGVNLAAFGGFTFVMGVIAGPALAVAASRTGSFAVVYQAFLLTSGIFAGLTFYAFVSKRDFSFLRGFVWTGLFLMIGLGLLGIFIPFGSVLHMTLAAASALLFSVFVLYDTSRILRSHATDEYVSGALSLFLDFFNLFLSLLRLMSRR